MAHQVSFTIPERQLDRADIEFRVQEDGATLGTLHVSRGAVDWVPANCQYGRRLQWSQLAALFEEKGERCTV